MPPGSKVVVLFTAPLLRVSASNPGVPGVPGLTISATLPVAAVGFTVTPTGTAAPCFTLTGLPEFKLKEVVDVLKVIELQLLTS